MTGGTYNGWTNYETWNVALWIDNEEPSSRYWTDAAKEVWADAEDHVDHLSRSESARYVLADRLKTEITDAEPDLGATMWSDLLGAALCEVNWDEIAGNMLDETTDYEREGD